LPESACISIIFFALKSVPQISSGGLAMSSTRTEPEQEVAPPVESTEPSSPAARRKFDTRSELSEQVGTDTVLVRDGKTPRQVLLEQIASEENEALARNRQAVAESASDRPYCQELGIDATSVPQTLARQLPCPRCKHPLLNLASLGVCQNCGYCHALEEARSAVITNQSIEFRLFSVRNLLYLWDRLVYLHEWLVLLFAGVTATLFLSFMANRLLVPESAQRALWTTLQISIGLAGIMAAQVWAGRMVKTLYRDGAKVSPLSPHIWVGIARQLPKSGGPTYLATWCLTLTVAAVFMIGGLGYWSKEDRSSSHETPTRLKAKEKTSPAKTKDVPAEPKQKAAEENK
jgi:hypothetical protein